MSSLPATDHDLTIALADPVASHAHAWRIALITCGLVALLLPIGAGYVLMTGIGAWGDRNPTGWGFPIVNFVWWIGIGHAGTFLSAILLVARQSWRSRVHRIAETMTVFAVLQAGVYPLLHLGRAWFVYWLVPYPATYEVWPQWASALTWDGVAVFTYLTVSVIFWYLGLVPDLATRRDLATGKTAQTLYALASLGWRGSAHHWHHVRAARGVMAGLATVLVISVHSIVSMDFASGLLPGWTSPIFPPYFVAGAIYSGLAMVVTIVVPLRKWLGIEHTLDSALLDRLGKLMLAMGLAVTYSYCCEWWTAASTGDGPERAMLFHVRPFGAHAPIYWAMIAGNVVAPQFLWFARVRRSPAALLVVALFVDVSMWAERLVLVVSSQEHDFLPSAWRSYLPSPVDAAVLLGTMGFFTFLMLLLARAVPVAAVSELKEDRHDREAADA